MLLIGETREGATAKNLLKIREEASGKAPA